MRTYVLLQAGSFAGSGNSVTDSISGQRFGGEFVLGTSTALAALSANSNGEVQ